MKLFRIVLGFLLNSICGFLSCAFLIIAITDIQGTAKGSEYNLGIELEFYRQIGYMTLSLLVVFFVLAQILIRKKLLKDNFLFFLSLCCFIVMLIASYPILIK